MSASIGSPAASPSSDKGFTLIEVLVAFAIAALLLVALLQTLTLGLDAGERSELYTRATLLAESALDAVGVVAPLTDGEGAELVQGPFHIQATVEPYHESGDSTQYVVLYRISATVSWREGHRARALTLTTLRLGPQQ